MRLPLWAAVLAGLAAALIERYGPPDAVTPDLLAWQDRGPWIRVIVWKRAPDVPQDDLEQTLAYRVAPEGIPLLARLKGCVRTTDDGAALSARSPEERLNVLALNLADDVLRGRMTPQKACDFYDRTVESAASGRSSRYMERLLLSDR